MAGIKQQTFFLKKKEETEGRDNETYLISRVMRIKNVKSLQIDLQMKRTERENRAPNGENFGKKKGKRKKKRKKNESKTRISHLILT